MNLIIKAVFESITNTPFRQWKEIILKIKADRAFASYTGDIIYENGNREPLDIFMLPKKFNKNFIRLHEDKTSNNGNKWNELEIRISPDKILELKYGWDQERQDRVDEYNKRFNS